MKNQWMSIYKWIPICAVLIFLCSITGLAHAVSFDKYFEGYNGTFVLKDLGSKEIQIYNKDLAYKKLPPQSTFKIPNALIGLQTKVVSSEGHLKKWDGTISSYSAHNHDHTLATAVRDSVVWYFQDMARDIGIEQMQSWMNKINYGNRDISGGVDTFWLESSLHISPVEQMDFIEKLYKEDLPFDKKVIQTVKKLITLEKNDSFILAGKTGTKSRLEGGWFVGYVVCKDRSYAFATYIDGPNASGPKAREITENIIRGELVGHTKL